MNVNVHTKTLSVFSVTETKPSENALVCGPRCGHSPICVRRCWLDADSRLLQKLILRYNRKYNTNRVNATKTNRKGNTRTVTAVL